MRLNEFLYGNEYTYTKMKDVLLSIFYEKQFVSYDEFAQFNLPPDFSITLNELETENTISRIGTNYQITFSGKRLFESGGFLKKTLRKRLNFLFKCIGIIASVVAAVASVISLL